MEEFLQDIRNLQQQMLVSKDEKLLTKQDVMALLGISDNICRRYVKMPALNRCACTVDLWRELEDSRRKVRF